MNHNPYPSHQLASPLPLIRRAVPRSIDLTQRSTVNTAIWLYFWLLIFEGALRKWILPGLASPLLLVRDPVAIYIILVAWSRNRFPINPYVIGMLTMGLVGTITAILIGHGNLAVALYGARILVIHFPLLFIIGNYFSRDDVLQMGRVILWLTLPMAILIAIQFYSPQNAWINRGIGGDISGGGFSGTMDYFRPPATFSFITGTAQFFSLSACYIFYFWINTKTINRVLLISATIGLLASIPLSISRSLFFQVIVSGLFLGIAVSRKPEYFSRFLLSVVSITLGLFLLSQVDLFKTSVGAFSERFESANEMEGGINGIFIDRFLGGMWGAISDSQDLPFWGRGIGMGTNVGAQLLSGDRTIFLISEGEWGRLIGEMGLLMGVVVILLRLFLILDLGSTSYKSLRNGNMLPWQLLSFGSLMILQGQWAQPATLGFSTLIGGLIVASLRNRALNSYPQIPHP